MLLGELSVPGRPTQLDTVGHGPIGVAICAGGGCWTFFLSSTISLFFLPLSGRRSDIDWYTVSRAVQPKTTNQPKYPFYAPQLRS